MEGVSWGSWTTLVRRCYVIALILAFSFIHENSAATRSVTHEDIKEAMVNFLRLFRDNAEKLERHELRERQLGESLKWAISALDKRERAQDDVLKQIFEAVQNLNARIGLLEAKVTAPDEDEDANSKAAVAHLEKLMLGFDEAMVAKYSDLDSKLSELTSTVEKLEKGVVGQASQIGNTIMTSQTDTNKMISESTAMQSEILNQIRNLNEQKKSGEYLLESFMNEMTSKVGEKTTALEYRLNELSPSQTIQPETLHSLMKSQDDMKEYLKLTLQDIHKDVKLLQKLEHSLNDTSENINDTKRRIDFGIHQILHEVNGYVKSQGSELNGTVTSKFSGMSDTILKNQNDVVGNLSTKVETELSQVWRQIGIMHTQITTSADVLDKLQNQTETYVVDSENKMDAMDSKLDSIESVLHLINNNYNYIGGRISLFNQELNETRTAVANVAKFIRNIYITDKPNANSTGPVEIPDPVFQEFDKKAA